MSMHQINIEVTSKCNGRCFFCYEKSVSSEKNKKCEIDLKRHAIISENLPTCENMVFTGGDPLIRRDVVEIIRCYEERGKNLILLTTAFNLDEKTACRLFDMDVHIQLPLHSVGKRLNEIMGRDAWNNTISTIKSFKKIGNEYSFSFVLTSRNLNDVEEIALTAVKFDCSSLLFIRMLPLGFGKKLDEIPSIGDIKNTLDLLDNISCDFGIPVVSGTPLPPCIFPHKNWKYINFAWCLAGTDAVTINPQGIYVFCPACDYCMGDALLEEPKPLNEKIYPHDCLKCHYVKRCRGGCRAVSFEVHGRWDMKEFKNLSFHSAIQG